MIQTNGSYSQKGIFQSTLDKEYKQVIILYIFINNQQALVSQYSKLYPKYEDTLNLYPLKLGRQWPRDDDVPNLERILNEVLMQSIYHPPLQGYFNINI